jgi:hypothetical protein
VSVPFKHAEFNQWSVIAGASTIFSFNEPDHSGSSYLSPLEGAERWPNMQQLADVFKYAEIT